MLNVQKELMAGWKFVGTIVGEGDLISLNGINPWQHKWNAVKEASIKVRHPSYSSQEHIMDIYEITEGDKTVRFAAGEFSNNAWGFFLPFSK
jgi:hypothetical protein